jgi:assimilatory nitrate reductase catalytic subunit
VHDNEVVSFEPWYDCPFNEGKLCSEGVKRYLQGSHPDRVMYPMERDEAALGGISSSRRDHVARRRHPATW